MAAINDLLLQEDGVLRFVMEGEAVNGVLPPFSREELTARSGRSRGSTAGESSSISVTKDAGIISTLRAELKHEHGMHIS